MKFTIEVDLPQGDRIIAENLRQNLHTLVRDTVRKAWGYEITTGATVKTSNLKLQEEILRDGDNNE